MTETSVEKVSDKFFGLLFYMINATLLVFTEDFDTYIAQNLDQFLK